MAFFSAWHELRGEWKYKIKTTGNQKLEGLSITGSNRLSATEYMPVNYSLLEDLLFHVPTEVKQGVLLDIGCGKGRAMCVAAANGFHKVAGIDIAKELIEEAEINLQSIHNQYKLTESSLHWIDVVEYEIPKDISCVFLFNPFEQNIVETLIRKLLNRGSKTSTPLYVLYASPQHAESFLRNGFTEIYQVKKAGFIEAKIFQI
ncbi:MAG: class I SAM-dependent methyltransferase [Chitinophagaceae bacterium]